MTDVGKPDFDIVRPSAQKRVSLLYLGTFLTTFLMTLSSP